MVRSNSTQLLQNLIKQIIKVFVKTNNVKRFITMMNNLQNRAEGVPGMGLVYGEPGLGKTQTINWWAFKNNAILVRCTQLMTARWLLNEIMDEMGEDNCGRLADCFKIIIRNLLTEPQVIIVDEVDYLFSNRHTIETLRDIHDKLSIPILLVGMELADKKLQKYGHINDRIFTKLRFEKLSKDDFKEIIETLSEVNFCDKAIKYIANRNLQFRQVVKIIVKSEQLAQTNKLREITEEIIKGVIDEE